MSPGTAFATEEGAGQLSIGAFVHVPCLQPRHLVTEGRVPRQKQLVLSIEKWQDQQPSRMVVRVLQVLPHHHMAPEPLRAAVERPPPQPPLSQFLVVKAPSSTQPLRCGSMKS